MSETAKKPGLFKRIGKYFKDMRGETKKIVWPTRKQVINNTLIVIAVVMVVGMMIWVVDALLGLGLSQLVMLG